MWGQTDLKSMKKGVIWIKLIQNALKSVEFIHFGENLDQL